MSKFTKLLMLMALGFFALINSSHASVVSGMPDCKMNTEIQSQKYGEVIALITKVRSDNFFPNPYCDEFKEKKIKIVATNNRAHMLMRGSIQELSLGVERGSSMGSEGPVLFNYWHIERLQIGGALVDRLEFSFFKVSLLEGQAISHKAEDLNQCHHEEEVRVDKVGFTPQIN